MVATVDGFVNPSLNRFVIINAFQSEFGYNTQSGFVTGGVIDGAIRDKTYSLVISAQTSEGN